MIFNIRGAKITGLTDIVCQSRYFGSPGFADPISQ